MNVNVKMDLISSDEIRSHLYLEVEYCRHFHDFTEYLLLQIIFAWIKEITSLMINHFPCTRLLSLNCVNSKITTILLSSFYIWGNWDVELLTHFASFTQQMCSPQWSDQSLNTVNCTYRCVSPASYKPCLACSKCYINSVLLITILK